MMKQGFMLYHSDLHNIETLKPEDFKELLLSLLHYSESGEILKLNDSVKIAFCFMSDKIARDQKKYELKCEQNRIKGRKSASLRKTAVNNSQPQSTTVDHSQQLQLTETVSETGTATDAVKENAKHTKRFIPPTLQQVIEYCHEKGFTIDAERFIDYYESIGWMVGNKRMVDWKAKLRNWAKGDNDHASRKRKCKTVLEQQYTQRDYNPGQYDDLTPEEVEEAQKYKV